MTEACATKGLTMTKGRVVIIPFLHGKFTPDGKVTEPDIDTILEKWLERHPEFRGTKFHVIKTSGDEDRLVRVTADFSPELAAYDPATDADLYQEFLAEEEDSPPPRPHKMWIEQCKVARGIEDEFGTDKALKYLVEEKFINFLEAAEHDADFRAEIPAFVARSRRSSNRGNCGSVWRRPGRPSHSIRASLNRCRVPCLARKKWNLTQKKSKKWGRMTFANAPVIC